jgi:hypothetical protein
LLIHYSSCNIYGISDIVTSCPDTINTEGLNDI